MVRRDDVAHVPSPARRAGVAGSVSFVVCLSWVTGLPLTLTANDGIEFFEQKIRPVLVEHCYECHSEQAARQKKLKGGLRLDTRELSRNGGDNLATKANLTALTDLSGQWIDRVHERHPPKMIVLDMDSSVSPTHGDQEGTAYNGHFGCSCYHPLFVFNQFGDLERSTLRPGNVHSAHGWRDVLEPVVARYRDRKLRRYFRGDAAFASPDIYEFLEAEGYTYAIRLKANAVLQKSIAHLLSHPVGRAPNHVRRFHASFSYQAGSWDRKRRVVAKVEWHPGELYPRVGFIVTNLSRPAERVVAFYNQRGTAEQYIKEGKNAIKWTRLSCRKFRDNAVRLQLHALAYNLANFMRTLALPKAA